MTRASPDHDEPLRIAGIDGGGTHTTCAMIRPDGCVTAIGNAGPGNLCTHPDAAPANLASALLDAMRADVEPVASVVAVTAGCAGYFACNVPGGIGAVEDVLRTMGPPGGRSEEETPGSRSRPSKRAVEILPDIEIALSGANLGGDAVVLIAGTGSVAYGGTGDGKRARAGGWGYLLADEGSAFWLGIEAIRAVLRAYDGRGPDTSLSPALLAAFDVAAPPDLEGIVYGMEAATTGVASLASTVIRCAMDGDAVARGIAEMGGCRLADTASAVLQRLGLENRAIPVATVGGVLQSPDSPVREALARRLHETAPRVEVIWPRLPPVGGALLRGMRLAGWDATPERLETLEDSLRSRLHPS